MLRARNKMNLYSDFIVDAEEVWHIAGTPNNFFLMLVITLAN